MISMGEAKQKATTNLEGYPSEVIEQYLAFAEDGNLARLDRVILGVLQFHLASPPSQPLTTMAGSTRLVDDLGCDSLAMVDMLFVAEEIFGVKILDDELSRVATLDDLQAHFRRHVAPDATVT
jgi:acyl carrier protein